MAPALQVLLGRILAWEIAAGRPTLSKPNELGCPVLDAVSSRQGRDSTNLCSPPGAPTSLTNRTSYVQRKYRRSNQQTTPESPATRAIRRTNVNNFPLRSVSAVAIRGNREFILSAWGVVRTNLTGFAQIGVGEWFGLIAAG